MNVKSLFVVFVAMMVASCARAAEGPVRDTEGLMRALGRAPPGSVIMLEPGVYTPVIHDFHGRVTITNADPAHPAIFSSLKVTDSSGLAFDGLDFDNTTNPVEAWGPKRTIAFQILTSSDITLTNLDVHGSPTGTLQTDQSGIIVRDSDHVTLSHSDFHNLNNGFQHVDDNYLTISHNHFHELRDDSMRGGGTSNLLIEGNLCEDNHPDGLADTDHPDCIQIWTSNTKKPAHDITIRGNRYDRGSAHATQFIWITDEAHLGAYENVTITGNVSVGSLGNAIGVQHVHNAVITDNTMTGLCGPDYNFKAIIPMIITGTIDGLVLKNNRAGAYRTRGGDINVVESGNVTVPCISRPRR